MELLDELLGLADLLSRERIPYAVCGGIALAIHGHPRLTRDIDLLVLPEDLDRLRGCAARAGFALESGFLDFDWGTPRRRSLFRMTKVQGTETLTLDLLLVNETLVSVWERRQEVEWRGRRLAVVSRAGLMEMKRTAGRPQDLADLDALGRGAPGSPDD